MPDILKVTTPLPSNEGPGRVRADAPRQEQQVIQTVTDPQRVTGPNAQDVYTEQDASKFLPNFESNYEMFLQTLGMAPEAFEEFRTLIFGRMGHMVSSGIEEGMAEEIAQFMEMLEMSEAELLEYVKEQLSGAVKFKGPFFDLLRGVTARGNQPGLQQAAANFLKSYDSLSSTQHILNELHANLENMAANMPKTIADKLIELAAGLPESLPNGQTAGVLAHARQEILPFLSRYMSATHDFGPARDFITMFVLNLARFEAGGMDRFSEALQSLLAQGELAARLPDVDAELLARALVNGTRDANELTEQLASILARGMKGEGGPQTKPVFENILRSMLVNESVYMPLLHTMIPANVDGQLMYSEVWMDPDADEGYEKDEYERAIKMLIKFDIKGTGCFDLVLLHQGTALDILLLAPPALMGFEQRFSAAIGEIATRNELSIRSYTQQPAAQPVLISEVFPKLYERKNAINVVV